MLDSEKPTFKGNIEEDKPIRKMHERGLDRSLAVVDLVCEV